MLRRRLLAAGLALAASPAARAQKSAGTGPLRLGVDHALVESRLGLSLQTAFSADTGIAVKLVAGPALAVLEATKEGELDAALTNAPAAEDGARQAGPGARPPGDRRRRLPDRRPGAARAAAKGAAAGGPQRGRGAGRIRDLAVAAPESVVFLSAGDGSGTHVAEQALWRAAGIAPAAPWYVNAGGSAGFAAKVRAPRRLCRWSSAAPGRWPAAALAVLADGDPLLAESVHAMRSFRASHPAGKIFIAWIGGGRGHAVVGVAPRLPAAGLRPTRDDEARIAPEPERRPRRAGDDQRPQGDDGDRQARRSRASARCCRSASRATSRPTSRCTAAWARRSTPIRASTTPFWQTVRAQAQVALWDEALPSGALGENLTLAGRGRERALDRRRAALSGLRSSPSASRAFPASSSTPRWASSTPPS